MTNKLCDICDTPLMDKDPVMAVVQAVYKAIPSERSFAISEPTDCVDIAHMECFYMERDADYEGEGAEFDD